MYRIVWIALVLFPLGLSPVLAQDAAVGTGEKLFDTSAAEELFNAGLALYNKKEYHKAIEKLEEAIKIDPDNAEAYYYIGYAYYKLKDMKKAVEVFDQAYEVDSKYSPLLRIPPDERSPLMEDELEAAGKNKKEPAGEEAPAP